MRYKFTKAAAVVAAILAGASQAQATAITGSIYFSGGFGSNGYDPTNGSVPPGYGNESSNTVAVGPGIEFGFKDAYNQDTADFSPSGITLEDVVLNVGASSWQQTFAASSPGYFDGLMLVSSTFDPGLIYSVANNTLTVDWLGEYYSGSADFKAAFSLPGTAAAVPEVSTWAMMIGGFTVVGAALRRSRPRKALA